MWHGVKQVAKSHRLPEEAFVQFARANENKYGLIDCEADKEPMVNTWYCNDLVRDFRKQWRG
jgi:hypothetical protein